MSRRLSLRARLTWWYTGVLSLGLILFSLTVWLALNQLLYGDVNASLRNHTQGFEEYLQIEDREPSVDLIREMAEYSDAMPEQHLIAVYDTAGRLLYSNNVEAASTFEESFRNVRMGEAQKFRWRGQHFLAEGRQFALHDREARIFLALPSDSTERALRILGWLLVGGVPVFIVCAASGGYWMSRRALQPLLAAAERARSIGIGNLSARLPVPETHDELQLLVETCNAMLQRLEAMVGQISSFTADASHELRTPVAIIRLAAENALRRVRSPQEYRAALEKVQRESESMTHLIEDLLFLARTDAEAVSTKDLAVVDVSKLIASVCQDLEPMAAAKQQVVNRHLPESSISVAGDSSELRRMLIILLDNAIKYTPAGGTITVDLEQGDGRAVLRVTDNGVGIPQAAQGRVFERFFRVDPSRSKESGGYGLGLAIAQAIVERHNGSLGLTPNATGGCVFSVSWPAAA